MSRWIDRIRDTEPARWAEAVRGLLAVAVALNWVVVDNETSNWIVSAFGVVLSWVLTSRTRDAVFSRESVARLRAELEKLRDRVAQVDGTTPPAAVPFDPVADPAADDPTGPALPRHGGRE